MSPIFSISTWYYISAIGIISFILNCWIKISKNKNLSLPPGPKGYPLIGNVYQTPQRYPWLVYAEWKEKYGSVSSFTVMGKTTIVLNSLKAAQDLLDHRSSNFSSRPRMVCDSPSFIVVLDYGSFKYSRSWQTSYWIGNGTSPICHTANAGGELIYGTKLIILKKFTMCCTRKHRKMFYQYFQPKNISIFSPFQRKMAIALLDQFSASPADFIAHIRQ